MARKKLPATAQDRMAALHEAAAKFQGWDQGREVLTPVRSIPTIFPQFDVATRVRGYPIQRVCMVHGPSNHGKTTFLLGLGRSFLEREHMYFHIDAEFTTPLPWVDENLAECAKFPTFRALRPENFEEVSARVREACVTLSKLRDSGAMPVDTTALFGVDSLQKLVPKDFLVKLLKDNDGIDPLKGRGGMVQAMLNSAWMKELIPLMYHHNAALVLLSRERENPGATQYQQKYTVGGGAAPYYDSSLVCRITRKEWVKRGSDDNAVVIGEKHMIQVTKTKVGHKDGKTTRCHFHTSNGKHIPAGFDPVRDVLEMAVTSGVVKKIKGGNLIDAASGEDYGTTNEAVVHLGAQQATMDDLRERVLAVAQPEEEEAA